IDGLGDLAHVFHTLGISRQVMDECGICGIEVLDDYCFCRCCQLLNSKKGCFFALSMAHVFQTILSVDVKEKAIAALISTLKMVHSAPLLIIDATGTSNRLPSARGTVNEHCLSCL
ncbi:MAG TPA: hypothetical protein VHV10_03055, partial [Ktedonobacteraceae bacterium]|nr:hypothetical protein [Ktedonobacteraceae bacterium]